MATRNSESIHFQLFGDLARWRVDLSNEFGPAVSYPVGTLFSRNGDIYSTAFFLLSGSVKIYTMNKDGDSRVLGYHGPDTIFELDSIRGGDTAVITAEAATDISVLALPSDRLKTYCLRHPSFCYDFLLFEQDALRLMCFRAEQHTGASVTSRLCSFLCLNRYAPEYIANGHLSLSQDTIADSINASRIQTARVLEKMKELGLLNLGRKKIWVLDWNRVHLYAEDPHSTVI